MKTLSENLFEKICSNLHIKFERISEESEPRPDYLIDLNGIKVVAEIKQIDLNPEEEKKLRRMEKGEAISFSNVPGSRVRSKISSSSKQISNISKGKCPGILVLYDNTPFAVGSHLEPYNIKVGMYGLEQFILSRPMDIRESPKLVDKKFGPKKKMTLDHNTSISALGVIEESGGGHIIRFYHNWHAGIPLSTEAVAAYGFEQYSISRKEQGEFQDWELTNG